MGIGVVAVAVVVGLAYLLIAQSASAEDSMKLSSAEIQNYASNAGFSDSDLSTAVAIAMAESSGNPQALGDPILGVSVGLWQINLHAHPEYSQQELFDPQTNANAAFAVYSKAGSDFSPWSTYKSGAYQQYL